MGWEWTGYGVHLPRVIGLELGGEKPLVFAHELGAQMVLVLTAVHQNVFLQHRHVGLLSHQFCHRHVKHSRHNHLHVSEHPKP